MAEFDPQQQEAPAETSPPPKKHVKRTAFFITATVIALLLFAAAVMEPLVSVLRYIVSLLSSSVPLLRTCATPSCVCMNTAYSNGCNAATYAEAYPCF